MARYFINSHPQPNGDHEVHHEDCQHLPEPEHRVYLGEFSKCFMALREAREHFKHVDGCFYCSPECNDE